MDHKGYRLYDVQSKRANRAHLLSVRNLCHPSRTMSAGLTTSVEQILFLGSITNTVLTDDTLKELLTTIRPTGPRRARRDRLTAACKKKTYIDDADIDGELT